MANDQDKKKSWVEKMKHTYRLVVMNNETFEEIGSYKLSLLNVYVALSTIVVVVAVAVVLLIAFTPVRRYIPGYGDAKQDEQLHQLTQDLNNIEREMNAHRAYADNVRRILVGDVQKVNDVPQIKPEKAESGAAPDEPAQSSGADALLRQEVDNQENGERARDSRTANLTTAGIPLEQLYFTAPITGEISAGFMTQRQHYGVDILAPKNTAIKAVMDGYVFLSDWTLETGNTIGIQHGNNIISFYKHNSVLLKKVGSFVRAGEAVAIIGNTGTLSDGPHLHFELWHRGNPVDPTEYIDF